MPKPKFFNDYMNNAGRSYKMKRLTLQIMEQEMDLSSAYDVSSPYGELNNSITFNSFILL